MNEHRDGISNRRVSSEEGRPLPDRENREECFDGHDELADPRHGPSRSLTVPDLSWVLGPPTVRYQSPVLNLVERRGIYPADGHEHLFTILELPDWVNVIAVTPDERVVFVLQYRVGRGETTIEIPGGMMDPEDADPVETARRELLEETGYSADKYELIGTVDPNPALQTNRCHTVLALGAQLTQEQNLDPSERIVVTTMSLSEVRQAISEGRIVHSLVIAAFFWYFGYKTASLDRREAQPCI